MNINEIAVTLLGLILITLLCIGVELTDLNNHLDRIAEAK